jgi:zinc and cadmium transporter
MNASNAILALALGLAAASGNVLGGFFVALGAGFMLGIVFLDVIPESARLLGVTQALAWALIGYFIVHLFEHTLAPHFHFGEETHGHELHHHSGFSALAGLMIHTFFDGVAIGSGFLVSAWLGWVISAAIFVHKLPEGFAVASLMMATGQGRKRALLSSVALGAATLVGIVFMILLRSEVNYALPLAGGVTLYVAASDLIPEVNREPKPRMAMLVFLGLAIVFLLHRIAGV